MNTLDEIKHFQWYMTDVLCNNANTIIGRSYYIDYPFAIFENKKEMTLIDGAIYNKSGRKVKSELDKISFAETSLNELLDKVKKFLLTTHGEFIVAKYNKEIQKCLIFNDALGRLPFYYSPSRDRSSDMIVMSREIKFIIPFLEHTDFHKLALAEYLLFGYPLGERTLFKAIKRLPPASILMMDIKNNKFLLKKVLSWNLEPESKTVHQVREETGKLVNLFLSSSRDIAQTFSKDYTHIVSLSGGLDSRALLAGLVKVGANPIAYSFPSGENRIARKVARELRVKYQVISSSFGMTNEDYVKLTDCLISTRLHNVVSYLFGVREKIGNKAILYTGDGGHQLKQEYEGTLKNIHSVEQLLEYIIETEHIFHINEISSMINIDKHAFKEHLKKHIMAYPEKTMEGKLIHFKQFERYFKWMFVGEDRNRLFLWSTTPFYSIRLFSVSMKIPQCFKEHYILYKNFLPGLNPVLSKIQYYDRLIPLFFPNRLLKSYLSAFEWLKRRFRKKGTASLIDLLRGKHAQEGTEEIRKLILRFLDQRSVSSFLVQSRVSEITKKTKDPTKLNILAPLVVYADLIKRGE